MILNTNKYYFPSKISDKEATDTGLAIVLLLLLFGYFSNSILYVGLAIPVLLLSMIYPKIYHYPAVLWLGFSKLLGHISSKIILSVVFIIIIVPVGSIRKLFGADALLLSQFKKNKKSVLITRNQWYTAKDIEKPY
jgi:hypothetical protein